MSLNQVRHDLRELDLILEAIDLFLRPRQQGRQRMEIIVVDFCDMRIRHDYERKVAKGGNPMREASREDTERKVRGIEQCGFRERRMTMPNLLSVRLECHWSDRRFSLD